MLNNKDFIWPILTDARLEVRKFNDKFCCMWDDEAELDVLADFITHNCSLEEFREYLKTVAEK